jgi:ParB-like chromosome segregation protein Spo0J
MQFETWPLTRFVHYARNPRKNDHVVDRMVASIKEFGFKVPVLARSSGEVVDGHLRLKAAEKLGISEIPVILCDDWTDTQVKAFRLLVNRSVTWADWDMELLALEISDLNLNPAVRSPPGQLRPLLAPDPTAPQITLRVTSAVFVAYCGHR